MTGGDASSPAVLAKHIGSWGVVYDSMAHWAPQQRFEAERADAHSHRTARVTKDTTPPCRHPALPCCQALALAAAQGLARETLPALCCTHLLPFPSTLGSHCPASTSSILAPAMGCFPVRGPCLYLTPIQLPKLAQRGSGSVCLGRRCIATNYF